MILPKQQTNTAKCPKQVPSWEDPHGGVDNNYSVCLNLGGRLSEMGAHGGRIPNSTHTHTQFVLTPLFVNFGSAHGALCNCFSCVPINCETIRLESHPRSQLDVQMSRAYALFLLNNLQRLKFKSMIIIVTVEET